MKETKKVWVYKVSKKSSTIKLFTRHCKPTLISIQPQQTLNLKITLLINTLYKPINTIRLITESKHTNQSTDHFTLILDTHRTTSIVLSMGKICQVLVTRIITTLVIIHLPAVTSK